MRTHTWLATDVNLGASGKRDNPADADRPLKLAGPCPCGCDLRDGPNHGYITAANKDGGFSIVAENAAERATLEHVMRVLRREIKR